MDSSRTDPARQLLLEHVDRSLTGTIDDPAVVAAVVAVERLVVATSSTDAAVLLAALEGRPTGAPDEQHVASLVAEAQRHVASGLSRRAGGQSVDAGVVNPDAGGYEITTDATLLRAAVRAAQSSIDAMPYYGARYGERGSRFASSDSAWLVSLARLPEARAIRQVEWLSGLLAGRGMPSWLMEIHLMALVSELRGVGGPDVAGSLPAAEASLATARRLHVDDELMTAADQWADELGDALPVPRTGALIASAVADELVGLARDDRSLMDWFTDPERVDSATARELHGINALVRENAR